MGEWELRKRQFLRRLVREAEEGRVDPDVLPLLEAINSMDGYYTTSSCSGRVQVYASRLPGMKFDMVTLGKWHWRVTADEVREAASRGGHGDVWLAALPPILHVVAKDLAKASELLRVAREVGFKHSGILSVREERVVLELRASERIEAPLLLDGEWVVTEEGLDRLVERANELLMTSKRKVGRLLLALRRLRPS
ncbi:MAG: hypothetical protein DRJ56_01355 [Thermoprotei archaeon]|nr:MAG: hypothetical protein DRJ56_01355 [Thermoprotei archaeon]